jgi:hypothetical protein
MSECFLAFNDFILGRSMLIGIKNEDIKVLMQTNNRKKRKFMLKRGKRGGCIPLISMEKSSSDGAEQMLMIEPERQ